MTGASLDNLTDDDITSTVTSFTMTDGGPVTVTNLDATSDLFIIDTDSSGNITQWMITALVYQATGPTTGPIYGATTCQASTDTVIAYSDCTLGSTPLPLTFAVSATGRGTQGLIDGDGGELAASGLVVIPPTTAVPEPPTLLLLGTGLVGLVGVGAKYRKVCA